MIVGLTEGMKRAIIKSANYMKLWELHRGLRKTSAQTVRGRMELDLDLAMLTVVSVSPDIRQVPKISPRTVDFFPHFITHGLQGLRSSTTGREC